MKRAVLPELLDTLPPDDPRAACSRRDLRRLNWLMRRAPIFSATLDARLERAPRSIIEIGAGDGTLMLELAKENHVRWPNVHVMMVDRQKTVSPRTLAQFGELGWPVEFVVADVFDWLPDAPPTDAILANLFLHHFPDAKLAELFRLLAGRTDFFLACETRRDWPSWTVARLLGLLGCNAVTRHDARVSMDAGFIGNELSARWPVNGGWQFVEQRTVVFTHLFIAQRIV